MVPDSNLAEKGILIITGSRLRAEQADRPLAYKLQKAISQRTQQDKYEKKNDNILVISDLWYLNSEPLQKLPTISLGGPGVNAVSAHFYDKLDHALVVDDHLLIQMDLDGKSLRACIWGQTNESTINALNIFIKNGYLDRFLTSATQRSEKF